MGKKEKDISKKNDLEDRKLQAILLADSFKNTFRPMTLDSPKALMPLVNVPMIMYTIEFLAQNGVDEVVNFIFHVNGHFCSCFMLFVSHLCRSSFFA